MNWEFQFLKNVSLVGCDAMWCDRNLKLSLSKANFYQTVWCHIPEDSTLHSHCCENPKSHLPFVACVHVVCSVPTLTHHPGIHSVCNIVLV
jgi:hypothetical protein